jgi:hypothetical protein
MGADWYRRAAHPVKIQVPKKKTTNDFFVRIEICSVWTEIDPREKLGVMLFGEAF